MHACGHDLHLIAGLGAATLRAGTEAAASAAFALRGRA